MKEEKQTGTATIHTTDANWVKKAIKAYTNKQEFNLVDDAEIGLTEKDVASAVNLMKFLKKENHLSVKEIAQILVGLGITATGVWMVMAAIADPEPTTKLGLLVGGGLVLAITGSLGTLRALGIQFSVSGKAFGNEFHISPTKKGED
jgi:hypothetical protein